MVCALLLDFHTWCVDTADVFFNKHSLCESIPTFTNHLMPRLHMQVWQPDTERKVCKNVPSCCSSSLNILFVRRIESLLHTASMKFEFSNLESCFHKRHVSFLVVKTAKCKRGISSLLRCLTLRGRGDQGKAGIWVYDNGLKFSKIEGMSNWVHENGSKFSQNVFLQNGGGFFFQKMGGVSSKKAFNFTWGSWCSVSLRCALGLVRPLTRHW